MDSELLDFIETSFGSVWALEIMLFLRRESGRDWAPDQLVAELRSSNAVVVQAVERLVSAGLVLVGEDGGIRYAPASPAIDRLAAALEAEYRRAPTAVHRVIVQTSMDKLKTFADAFKVTKK